jgi:Sigma-70 region 2
VRGHHGRDHITANYRPPGPPREQPCRHEGRPDRGRSATRVLFSEAANAPPARSVAAGAVAATSTSRASGVHCGRTETTSVPVHADGLLARLNELAPGDARRVALRAGAIEWYLPMAVYLARRFAGCGEPQADLTQVAVIGLIKALDRFNVDHGVPFPTRLSDFCDCGESGRRGGVT